MSALKKITALVGLMGVMALTACSEPVDVRNEVQTAIASELITEADTARFLEGDEAAVEFVDGMHELAEMLASDIIDDDICGSAAYETGLGDPTLVDAHRAGCDAFEEFS